MTDPTPSTPPQPSPVVETLRPVAHLQLKAMALLLFTLALIVGSGMYLLYARGAFEPTQTLVLTADDSEGVVVGMDMTFSGFPIGRVRRIELSDDGNVRILVDVPRKDAHWLRQSGHFDALRAQGGDPVRMELLPRVVAGVFASITLAALSCVVALIMAYISVYGFNLAGLPSYTRMFGHVFSPAVTLVFALKTLFSSLAVALIPTTAGMYDAGEGVTPDSELGGLARMFAVLLLIEVGSLVGNYY